MSEIKSWNDESREKLRVRLRNEIVGELRLARFDHGRILDFCRAVHFSDECPEDEWDMFDRFAAGQLDQAAAVLDAEQSNWPHETDCDRMDRVEAALRDCGILLWQVSPCCDTCTVGELYDRVELVDKSYPGFRERVRGYAFFIDQNMAEMLAESTRLTVYLGYGWRSPDDTDVSHDLYEINALSIAHEVCDCLRRHGFEPRWNGELSTKIGVSLDWKRRAVAGTTSDD